MNEHEPTDPGAPPQQAPEKPSVLRKILFAILAVMIVALIYEYGFVLRSYRNAENTIDDMIEQRAGTDLDEPITPAVVQQSFGKQPLNVTEGEEKYLVEHYQWRRWLPWKTFDIYVVYQAGDPPTLFNTTRPHQPGPQDLPVMYNPPMLTGNVEMPELSSSPGAEAEPTEQSADEPAGDDTPLQNAGDDEPAGDDTPPQNAGDEDAPAADAPAADAPETEEPAPE